MRTFYAPPYVELAGFMTAVFVDNLQGGETLPIFEKYGLVNLDPNGFYPTHRFMDAMNELALQANINSNLMAVGLEVGKIAPLVRPVDNPTLADALSQWNDMYHVLHQNHQDQIGQIEVEKVSDTHYKTIHTDLYPDDFTYGIAYSFARRFLPPGTQFTVFYDPDVPQRDEHGGEKTVIHVKWA